MNEQADVIRIHGLEIRRGAFRLEVPRWTIQPGQIVGLVGPNGSGKTTLLEAMAGIRSSDSGSIRIFGLDPRRDPVRVRTSLGYMSDDLPLFELRIDALLRTLSGYYPTWDAQLVDELLERFRVDPHRRTHELSRGEGTRLRLVLAMAFRPRVLIMDEPASGLDLAGRRTLLDSVLEVVRDPGRTVIVSSHLLNDVERIADRLLVLDGGSVMHEGSTDILVGDDRTLEEALIAWGAAG